MTVSRLHRSGADACRVLLVGGAALTTARYAGAAERAAEEVADFLQSKVRTGVDLDVLWELGPALAAMTSVAEPWRIWPYDVVVIVLPTQPESRAGRRPYRVSDDAVMLAVEQVQSLARVAVVTTSHRPGSYVTPRQGGFTQESVQITPLASDLPLPRAVGGLFAELLSAGRGSCWRAQPQDDGARHRALVATHALQMPLERGLNRVVAAAKNSFGLDGAMVNLLDADELWTVAAAGAVVGRQPRHGTLCNLTIRTAGVTVFEDTWTDRQFDGNPIMHGTTPLRFYAGYPIESIDGYRIGTICVYDRDPHDRDEFDFSMLRDLALLAEGEVLDAARTPQVATD